MTNAARILVSIPNWVGDVVMATAALRAIRRQFAKARIVHLMRPYVADVLAGTAFCDDRAFWPLPRNEARRARLQAPVAPPSRRCSHRRDARATEVLGGTLGTGGLPGLIRRLRHEQFDLAILLTNSFRSAMAARLAGARRRVGYARDARSWLLTDRLKPLRDGRQFVPVSALDYYNELARHVGCEDPGDRLELATLPADETAIDERLGPSKADGPLVVLNPGANYGSAKCWPAERYAEVANALVERHGARVVASLVPKEREIADRLKAAVRQPIDVFVDPPLGLGPLKALIRRCRLLITNDTGPRHFAAAFGIPVVTVFGSSDPAWTVTRFAKERIAMLDLDCQPCMERTCPLKHHRCMRELSSALVLEKAAELLASFTSEQSTAGKPCS